MTGRAETPPPGVSVATVLRDLADSRALDLELLAGGGGVERRITNSHPQKTGLALSGFDAYLRDGRVLVFGESEVRYMESLSPRERSEVLRLVFAHALPCLLITGGLAPPPQTNIEADRANMPLLRSRARRTPHVAIAASSTSVSERPRNVTPPAASWLRRSWKL